MGNSVYVFMIFSGRNRLVPNSSKLIANITDEDCLSIARYLLQSSSYIYPPIGKCDFYRFNGSGFDYVGTYFDKSFADQKEA